MTNYVFDQSRVIGFYESGTYATASGAAFWVGGAIEHTSDEGEGIITARYIGDGTRNYSQLLNGPRTYNNTMNFHIQDWRMLKFALGSCLDAGSPSPYSHTYAETDNNDQTPEIAGQSLPSFTIEESQRTTVAGSHFVRTFKGCVVDSMNIIIAQGEPVRMEVGYVAQSVAFSSGAASAVTIDATRPYMWSDTRVHIPSGTTFDNVTELNIGLTNNNEANHYLDGDRTIGKPVPTMRDYEISMTLKAQDTNTKTLYDQYFLGGSTFNMLVPVVQSAGSEEGMLTFSGCRITDMSAPTTNEAVSEQVVTIVAQTMGATEADSVQYKNIGSYA